MDRDKINDLLGSLVKAKIVARCSLDCAIGRYGSEKLLVTNGAGYLGSDCLVKIDSNEKSLENGLIGNFVSSNIPTDFHDLSYMQYILFALWEDRMKKNGRYPTIEEINRHFDPGNIITTYYISPNPGRNRSTRTLIYHGGYHTSNPSIKKMIETLTFRRRTRLIIAETEYLMRPIFDNIRDKGLVPILMEPKK